MGLDRLSLEEDFQYLFCRAYLKTFEYPLKADPNQIDAYKRARGLVNPWEGIFSNEGYAFYKFLDLEWVNSSKSTEV